MPKTDPLAAALANLDRVGSTSRPKVDVLWGDRPAVLDAIREARRRHVSYGAIAKILTADLAANGIDDSIGESAVKTWCNKNGVD